MSSTVFRDRILDLRILCRYAAEAVYNTSGGIWNKFCTGGTATGVNAARPVKDPEKDAEIFAYSTFNELFTRTEDAKDYVKALDESEPALNAIKSKRKSDLLSSMQQATRLRYMSRIRHMAASMSRDTALTRTDIAIMEREISK